MEKDSPKLVLDEEWLSSTTTEALLFIHGYDHNLDGKNDFHFKINR